MQCQSECRSAFKSVVNIRKPFEKTFMNTMKLFMAIPDRINFLQLGRYGCFRNRPTTTFWKTKLSTGLHSTIQSSVNILQAKENCHRSFLYSQVRPIRHLGLVTSGQAVQGSISVDWKSWVSESLASITIFQRTHFIYCQSRLGWVNF